jgi:transmembrane sensor
VLAGTAAASVAYLLARPPLHLWPAVAELMASYRTATGERRQLAVASGIAVEMDTQTSVATPTVVGELYSLELISGQLAVSVHAQAERSVVIAAAGGQTRTDRGGFDVRRDGASVCVTCTDGAVQVSYRSSTAKLQSGQQVIYNDRGLGLPLTTDPTVVTAWQRGLLIFHDLPLAEVVAEVNRYRRGRIILLNDALAERKVVAGFRIDQIDDIVNYIVQAFGARARPLPGGVVLLS